MAECKSFKPQITKTSKVLILGSMPGVKSLEEAQYYAHPYNRFWKVMGHFCGADLDGADYKTKVETLLKCGFALWDVIGFCKREGSLDSAITNEVPNDIPGLLTKFQNIEIIILNGNKAYSAFKKHFPELLDRYNKVFKVPSTSPANARFNLEDLIYEWGRVINNKNSG